MDMGKFGLFLIWLFISCVISAIAFFFSLIVYAFITSVGLPMLLFNIFAGILSAGLFALILAMFIAMIIYE